MNKGDALLLELDFNVNGEALQEGEWDDIELVLGSHSYTLSNGDIYWDGETYVVFLSQEDSFKLNFTNMYQLRLLKDGFVISSKAMKMKVGGCLSRVILGDSMANLSRYNELIEDTLISLVSDAELVRPYCFYRIENLETVRFTEATSIGEYAFNNASVKTAKLDKVTVIEQSAFGGSDIETVNAPLLETIGVSGFSACHSLTSINAPKLKSLGMFGLGNCNMEEVRFPELEEIGNYCLNNNASLKVADLGHITAMKSQVFASDTYFNTLILRSSTMVSLPLNGLQVDTTSFSATQFSMGDGGTIYVPYDLIETYQNDFRWQAVMSLHNNNQFLPIEGSIYE